MAEVNNNGILIRDVETKNIMTKSTLPVGGYSVNPYVGCTHGCKYCYASFMKRFTGHTEPWGTFLDVKYWPAIKNPRKYAGQRVVIGSVTDGYLPQEAQFQNTRKLLEQLRGSEAEILICTKSDLVIHANQKISTAYAELLTILNKDALYELLSEYSYRLLQAYAQQKGVSTTLVYLGTK